MRIGILGTRGIPNHYGGFEQFVEFVAPEWVKQGCEVYVYCSSLHPYKEKTWKNVHLIHCKDPENKIGTAGQFIYDLNCIIDARKRNFDVLLQLGYTSSSIWWWLMPKKAKIITNMDGLEWKRTKYSKKVQTFLKYAEKWAVNHSDHLVADSKGIQDYLQEKYQVNSTYIAYGAEVFQHPNEAVLKEFQVEIEKYSMLIARFEPENNLEMILDGVALSEKKETFLVVGNHNNGFGEYLKEKYKTYSQIKFIGAVYNLDKLNNLRYFSRLYFHGHSVGGTNPSLLEAMASNALIAAHNNGFNKGVLEDNAFYFTKANEVSDIYNNTVKSLFVNKLNENKNRINETFNWDLISNQYLSLFKSQLNF